MTLPTGKRTSPARPIAPVARVLPSSVPAPAARPAGRRASPLVTAVLVGLSLAYPVFVYLSLGHLSPRWVALLLVVLAFTRAWITRETFWLGAACLAALLAAASFLGDQWGPLKLYPALVNLVCLGVFGLSLWRGPTVVERFARLRDPAFPQAAVGYTRRVTQVWCAYFIVNGSIAAATALWASTSVWTLYNGVLSYVGMGVLMAGELAVRRGVRARIHGAQRDAAMASSRADASGGGVAPKADGAPHG